MTQTAMSPLTVAPEIKHAPDTMTAAFEDFMGAFESFKETNDRRLAEIEGKLTAVETAARELATKLDVHVNRCIKCREGKPCRECDRN